NCRLGMILRRLLDSLHSRDFREYDRKHPGLIEQFEPLAGRAFCKQLGQFVPYSLRRNLLDFPGVPANRRKRGWVDRQSEPRRKAHGSKHAQLVLFEAAFWLPDRPDDSLLKVFLAVNIVEYLAGAMAHEQPIDGEVAALHVFFRSPRILHAVGMAPIRIADIR